uniref:Uncharacterized protein n=1 Tax=Setaria italica TaxID=4555 RepID=K4AHR4_SETIT
MNSLSFFFKKQFTSHLHYSTNIPARDMFGKNERKDDSPRNCIMVHVLQDARYFGFPDSKLATHVK